MQTSSKTILNLIESVYLEAKDSKLDMRNFSKIESEINELSSYFQVSPTQVILLSVMLGMSGANDVYIHNLSSYMNIENLHFLNYLPDFKELEEKSILTRNKRKTRFVPMAVLREQYAITQHLLPYIIENKPIPKELLKAEVKENTFIQFLVDLDLLRQAKREQQIDYYYFSSEVDALVESNKNFKLIEYVMNNKLSQLEYCVFFDVIFDTINAKENVFISSLQSTTDDFSANTKASLSFITDFLSSKTRLNTLNLIEKNNTKFGNDFKLRLSKKALDLLADFEKIELNSSTTEKSNILVPTEIKKIQLYYNPTEKNQLDSITKSLGQKAFYKLQEQLKKHNMPHGISCLLFGEPGTGKTESVYQLAKKTNRAVMLVDIAETKSMWFGESQKLVKKIFSDYYKLQSEQQNCPILLFNEADAVIGKRKNAGSSAVADTENAIQNILLEEMENFKGILFATTNLIKNLDAAFERRFLFKVEFSLPSLENAAKIWKSKLAFLSLKECRTLAESFRFSGGEMENIARKCILENVIHQKVPTLIDVIQFCKNEKWETKKTASNIGYNLTA
jgi:hypothetical protein